MENKWMSFVFVRRALVAMSNGNEGGKKMRALKFCFIVSVLSVMSCLGSEARAVDRIRIDSIEPSVVDQGGEFTLRGVDLLCSGRSYASQTQVQVQWRTGNLVHLRHLSLSVILDNEIKAHVPRNMRPGEYAIYIVNYDTRSRQLKCQSNPVNLTVRQPAPPAVAADPYQVLSNPCSRHSDAEAVADQSFHLPGTTGSSPPTPTCPYPMKFIQLINDGRPAIYPAALISISGITLEDQNMVIAILRADPRARGPLRPPYFVAKLLTVHLRRQGLTIVRLPYDLDSGTYRFAALYRFVRDRSLRDLLADPIGALATGRPGPLYVMGSNTIDLEIAGPTHR
jgi:hypothetical protein